MAFWSRWFNPKPLRPGICQCGHKRCHHVRGKRRCTVAVRDGIHVCACEIYIPIDHSETEIEVLERMYKKGGK